MPQGSIDREGAYIDISVPVEFAQAVLDRILDCHKGISFDPHNSYADNSVHHLRLILKVAKRAEAFQLVKDIAKELGVSVIDKTG